MRRADDQLPVSHNIERPVEDAALDDAVVQVEGRTEARTHPGTVAARVETLQQHVPCVGSLDVFRKENLLGVADELPCSREQLWGCRHAVNRSGRV